tara:strand:+ start:3450 stop:3926 length:477 start_codon:yes stop_codon:yes gene_type:complete
MEDINKSLEFLSYIRTPLSSDSINVLLSANNVKYECSQLYGDFIQSLLAIVFDTYMGDEITNEVDRINHFNWCWGKNLNNFKDEGINFNHTKESYDYFLEFMYEVYYSIPNKELKPHIPSTISILWFKLFSYNAIKTRSDVDNFIEVYSILDKSLKKG